MAKKRFYSLLNVPNTISSPSGEDIYEWTYLDSTNSLKEDKKNVYEEIQSHRNEVDYKRKIQEGETFENGSGIYLDTRKFNGDYGDVNEYLARLASSLRSQVNQVANDTPTVATKETVETPKVIEESGSNSSGSGTVDNGQGGSK